MSNYIVLENIPNTPEGRAFLKQLRKYLRPQYKMRSRGRHKDRKGLAKELAAKGVYANENHAHRSLRAGMSCKHADRITTVVEARNERGIEQRHIAGRWGYWVYPGSKEQLGPFKTWDAARAAKRVTEGFK